MNKLKINNVLNLNETKKYIKSDKIRIIMFNVHFITGRQSHSCYQHIFGCHRVRQ